MNAIGWISLAVQTACFIGSSINQARMKPPSDDMVYFAKETRRYYRLARVAYLFQAAFLAFWIVAMMHVEGK